MSALRLRVTAVFLALLSLALVAPPAFGALPQRTFVASYGLDTSPCSLALPCRSFDVAVPAVTPGGEVIVLDSAGYGPATITQSVSIIAPAGVYAGVSVIAPANNVGVTINAPGIKVVLQNLAINGLGGATGIWVQQAAEVDINNCTVSNFTVGGIYAQAVDTKLNVRDTLVRYTNGAIRIGGQAVLERIQVVGSAGSIYIQSGAASIKHSVVFHGTGIGVSPGTATVEDTLIADSGGIGVFAPAASTVATLTAARNMITRSNDVGVFVSTNILGAKGTAIATLSDNLISQSGGVFADQGAVATVRNNTFAGNGTTALYADSGATIHTVKGADGLPSNGGVPTTPTGGNVIPSNPF